MSARLLGGALAVALLVCLGLPLLALALSASPAQISDGMRSPLFSPALWLSLRTSLISVGLIVLTGTPLAWWLARTRHRSAAVISVLVDLPIVIPPAVIGVALLQTYGRRGMLGPALEALDWQITFSTTAVIMAQVVVAAPFYVQAAANAFRKVDADVLIVARTLGASRAGAFFRVGVPVALPGLIGGISLAWARALGEFGATLLFAGSLVGETQTMPLAIFAALESDVQVALVFAILLAALGGVALLLLRWVPTLFRGRI
ncbi:MAG: molybdate transport system permease protein [Bradymonadia bacterium]